MAHSMIICIILTVKVLFFRSHIRKKLKIQIRSWDYFPPLICNAYTLAIEKPVKLKLLDEEVHWNTRVLLIIYFQFIILRIFQCYSKGTTTYYSFFHC